MVNVRVKEEWYYLLRWYCRVQVKQAHPTGERLDQELAVMAELYRCRSPERLKVPILVHQTEVDDEVPTEAEVNLEVGGIKAVRAGVLSGMRAEDLKRWCRESKQEMEPVGRRWDPVVRLVQVMFRDSTVPVEIVWENSP